MTVTLPAFGLQLHSIALTVTLPFYAGPLYATSTGSARYQCVASNTSIHVQQNNKHNCAAANAGIMAHCVCISPSVFYTDAVRHLFCRVQRGSKHVETSAKAQKAYVGAESLSCDCSLTCGLQSNC